MAPEVIFIHPKSCGGVLIELSQPAEGCRMSVYDPEESTLSAWGTAGRKAE